MAVPTSSTQPVRGLIVQDRESDGTAKEIDTDSGTIEPTPVRIITTTTGCAAIDLAVLSSVFAKRQDVVTIDAMSIVLKMLCPALKHEPRVSKGVQAFFDFDTVIQEGHAKDLIYELSKAYPDLSREINHAFIIKIHQAVHREKDLDPQLLYGKLGRFLCMCQQKLHSGHGQETVKGCFQEIVNASPQSPMTPLAFGETPSLRRIKSIERSIRTQMASTMIMLEDGAQILAKNYEGRVMVVTIDALIQKIAETHRSPSVKPFWLTYGAIVSELMSAEAMGPALEKFRPATDLLNSVVGVKGI